MSRHSSAGGGPSPALFFTPRLLYHPPGDTEMIDLQLASLITQILIGSGQIGIVYYGISRMMQASDSRSKLQSELMQRQERESIRRHTETMTALRELIARTGGSGAA